MKPDDGRAPAIQFIDRRERSRGGHADPIVGPEMLPRRNIAFDPAHPARLRGQMSSDVRNTTRGSEVRAPSAPLLFNARRI